MSTIKKLQGGTDSELTRLKALWRGLEESAREFWREQFVGPATQAATRKLILARLQINLASDNQLNRFRDWLVQEDARQKQADRMEANEAKIMEAHPEWTADQVREQVIRSAYFETLASGDYELGLKTVTADLNVKRTSMEDRRITLLEKKAAAFDQIKALRDPKAAMNDEDRKAIVEKVDEILGLK